MSIETLFGNITRLVCDSDVDCHSYYPGSLIRPTSISELRHYASQMPETFQWVFVDGKDYCPWCARKQDERKHFPPPTADAEKIAEAIINGIKYKSYYYPGELERWRKSITKHFAPLAEALAWYGDERNYNKYVASNMGTPISLINKDRGQRARDAMKGKE